MGQDHCLTLTQDFDIMTISNISSKATGAIVIKFYIALPWPDGRNVCSNNPGHIMNIFMIKPLKLFFSGTSGPIALKFDM